jgi:hypothetical protein
VSVEELVARYITSADHVCRTMEMVHGGTGLSSGDVRKVAETAKAYLEDAKHFRKERKLEVSLTAVAYCEGLLDALRMLGAARFEWPSKLGMRREK